MNRKRPHGITGIAAVLVLASTAQAATILVANLSIDQEPPPITPMTTTGAPRPIPFGTATFTLNDAMTQLSFMATVFNIDVTGTQTADINDNLVAAHIHAAASLAPPATAGVVWGFFGMPFNNNNPSDGGMTPFTTGVGGTFTGTWDMNEGNNTNLATQLPNILAGRSYINFHTTQYGGGEIRGALTVVPEPSTFVLLGLGIAGAVAARRRCRS